MKGINKELDDACRAYIKRRDNYTCSWCGESELVGRNCQWAHIIPRSNGFRLRWHPRNSMCMCFGCHEKRWHESGEGRLWFDNTFPEEIEFLLDQKALNTLKFTKSDKEELLAAFENDDPYTWFEDFLGKEKS